MRKCNLGRNMVIYGNCVEDSFCREFGFKMFSGFDVRKLIRFLLYHNGYDCDDLQDLPLIVFDELNCIINETQGFTFNGGFVYVCFK